ncbi:MAG TPA: DNA-binding response regulator [Cytophagales bacterium]|nr:DNA-binding response regulator [Cytophagales bacterium]HAA20866.1 DNA-binding response regulator [Cytophagales bacterium]HAP59155.1 DNA-binding response regulator [Cytophagales bacterium]
MKLKCMVVDDDQTSRQIVEHYVKKTNFLRLDHVCESAIDASNILMEEDVDILFLDVEMPEMSGMDLLKTIDNSIEVIMVTSARDYAPEAFEAAVTDYLVKPIEYSRFLKAVTKAKENIEAFQRKLKDSDQNNIYVKTDAKIVKITMDNIQFIEALADYVVINTEKKKYIVHSTMKGIEKRLPERYFARVHRSYIVNVGHIEALEDNSIMIKEKGIPIGASYKDNFLSRLNFL